MIKPNTKWRVCSSGDKDSYTLFAVLHELKWRGLLPVELVAYNFEKGTPNFPVTILPEFLEKIGVTHPVEYEYTYSIIMDKIRFCRNVFVCLKDGHFWTKLYCESSKLLER